MNICKWAILSVVGGVLVAGCVGERPADVLTFSGLCEQGVQLEAPGGGGAELRLLGEGRGMRTGRQAV